MVLEVYSEGELDWSDSPLDEETPKPAILQHTVPQAPAPQAPAQPAPAPPAPAPPAPAPPAPDREARTRDIVKMFSYAVTMASEVEEWKKGVYFATFAFSDDDSRIRAERLGLQRPHEVLFHCLDRIKDKTHPEFGDLTWNIDQFNKIKVKQPAPPNKPQPTYPAIERVQPLVDLQKHSPGHWVPNHGLRSRLWRELLRKSAYLCRTKALLFFLLCAPKDIFVPLCRRNLPPRRQELV